MRKLFPLLLVVMSLWAYAAPADELLPEEQELQQLEQMEVNYRLQRSEEQSLANFRRKLDEQRDILDRTSTRPIGIPGVVYPPPPTPKADPTVVQAEEDDDVGASVHLSKAR